MKLMKLFLLVLAVSLIIQNTCPYGLAAKTGFTAKEVHHCPLKKYSPSKTDADDSAKKAMFQAGQTFVFTVGSSINAKPMSLPEVSCSIPDMYPYKNIFAEPPLKPPRPV
ncbi:MAG: hypothetical protein C4550_01165 [Nitrospiraceae bacterium]|nr:MAG: hypothetical protein C4550_01165 [Nitrospiraceae bacterium]